MSKQRKEEIDLRKIRQEINRIDNYYSGQLGNMDGKFKDHILEKLSNLKKQELQLMKTLKYA